MPIYYLNSPDMSFSTQQFYQGVNSPGGTILPGNTETWFFYTGVAFPNAQSASAGSCSIVIQHAVTSMNITVQPVLYRYRDGVGNVTSTSFAAQTTAATNTFTGVDPSWSGSICSDRILLVTSYNNNAMSAQTYQFFQGSFSYYSSSIPINTGSCPVLKNRTFVL